MPEQETNQRVEEVDDVVVVEDVTNAESPDRSGAKKKGKKKRKHSKASKKEDGESEGWFSGRAAQAAGSVLSKAMNLGSTALNLGGQAGWVAVTSSLILILPVVRIMEQVEMWEFQYAHASGMPTQQMPQAGELDFGSFDGKKK